MVQETKPRQTSSALWGVPLLGVSIVTLIASLSKPAAAAPGEGEPLEVVGMDDVRTALAALLLQGEAVKERLDTANACLVAIIEALGGSPPGGDGLPGRELEPFQQDNQTLESGANFALCEKSGKGGALVWAVVDVSDPNTDVNIKIDNLSWTFNIDKVREQGIDKPLFPGVWLSRYDAATSHYALVFSAGSSNGMKFGQSLKVIVTFKGVGSATLHQGRGVLWSEV